MTRYSIRSHVLSVVLLGVLSSAGSAGLHSRACAADSSRAKQAEVNPAEANPAEAESAEVPLNTYQVVGLFNPERVPAFREAAAELRGVELKSVDFEKAEATFRFDPNVLFKGVKPDEIVRRLDNQMRGISHSTFSIKPRSTTPREKLKLVEIPVVGLDCAGCCLGAYEIVMRVPGVEQATASFKAGLITALVDAEKTDRAAIETALKMRNVKLKDAETDK